MLGVSANEKHELETIVKAIDDKFGIDIVVLDIRKLSILTDYFIIATGASSKQVKAIVDEIDDKTHRAGASVRHMEGYADAHWVLMDFGDIIVHIFDKENREFYNIERVWGDAPVVHVALPASEELVSHGR